MRSASSSQRECVLTVANEVRLSTRRGKAEAKEPPFVSAFLFFLGGGRGFYLRSVAPSAPKPPLTPLHVRGCCTTCRLNLTLSRHKFKFSIFEVRVSANKICKFDFKFERKTIRRSIFVLDEALLNLATGVTVLVMTEPNLKVTKYRAKRRAVI